MFVDFLPFLLQVLSLYVYAILLKEFRLSMVLGKSNTKVSKKYCRAPVIYMYKEDLALNNLKWLICHRTQPTNQPTKNQSTKIKS